MDYYTSTRLAGVTPESAGTWKSAQIEDTSIEYLDF